MFARTERLLLRPGWAEDAPALFRAIADEAIVRNLARAPWPYRVTDAEDFLARDSDPRLPACLMFSRTAGAPRLVGGVGLHADDDGQPSLGYWVARPYWGLGYATEGAAALLAAARDTLRLGQVSAWHFLDNPASGRVLRKLGFSATGQIADRYSAGRGGRFASAHYRQFCDEEARPCDAALQSLAAA
jgi:RimJ/RimL family protein N-acetyltransferase